MCEHPGLPLLALGPPSRAALDTHVTDRRAGKSWISGELCFFVWPNGQHTVVVESMALVLIRPCYDPGYEDKFEIHWVCFVGN